jgi:hypothetical protein
VARAEILEGKKNHGARVGESCQQFLGDRPRMVTTRLLFAIRADGLADFGEEQPQQVGELGGGADGRTGGADRIFLLYRDRGADVGDPIDVGPVHLVEKHPCVGRERFHIAPLSFREQCVEGQGRFAGSGQPGDGGDPVVRIRREMFLRLFWRAPSTIKSFVVRSGGLRCATAAVPSGERPSIVASAAVVCNVTCRRRR